MKLDKETLIKHRFWFLLGLEVPLVLIATAVLMLGVRGNIAARELALKKVADEPKKVSGAQNQRCVDEWQKKEEEVTAIKEEVWKDAWNQQKLLTTWPEQDLEKKFNLGLFATKVKVVSEGVAQPVGAAEAAYLFRGEVTTANDPNRIEVTVKDGKGRKQTQTFYFTPGLLFNSGSGDKTIKSFTDNVLRGQKVEVAFLSGKYFGDDFTINERQTYTKSYYDQFKDLKHFFDNARKKPLVLVRDDWVEIGDGIKVPAVLRRKRNWSPDKITDERTPWEIWYAQEDFWIQRELLRAMHKANEYVARFKPGDTNPEPTAESKTFTFSNDFWKLELNRKADQITATLTNISRKKQRLDLTFLVQLSNEREPRKWDLKFPGETLNPGVKSKPLPLAVDGEKPAGFFGVEQVLTLDSAPVKRLDELVLGDHSHRTFPKKLVPWFGEKAGDQKEAEDTPPPVGKKAFGRKPKRGRGKPQPGLKEEDEDTRKRYSLTTEQFRRMPVSLVFLVDQDSAHYVLTALEESSLRFQVTQVALTRYPKGLQVDEPGDVGKEKEKEDAKDKPVVKDPMIQAPKRRRPLGGRKISPREAARASQALIGGQKGPGTEKGVVPPEGGPAVQSEGGGGDEAGPVMELTIYGYVTLYERYPPKPEAAALKVADNQPK